MSLLLFCCYLLQLIFKVQLIIQKRHFPNSRNIHHHEYLCHSCLLLVVALQQSGGEVKSFRSHFPASAAQLCREWSPSLRHWSLCS